MENTRKTSPFFRSLLISLLLAAAAMAGVLIWSAAGDTPAGAVTFRLICVPVLLFLGASRWFLDGMAFVVMAEGIAARPLRPARAAVIRLITSMVASVIPVLVGSLSVHAYLLHKEKISFSESAAMSVLRSIIPVFLFLLNIPLLLLIRSDLVNRELYLSALDVVTISLVAVVVFIVIALFYPRVMERAMLALIRLWRRLRLPGSARLLALEENLALEMERLSEIFWKYFRERKMTLLKAGGWILAAWIMDFTAAIVIIAGFGGGVDVVLALIMQFLIRPVIYIAFTPAGAGVWEFTYGALFLLFLPKPLVGVAVLVWRMVLSYLPMAAGGVLLAREIARDDRLRSLLRKQR
ncbi:flippase-like domain-containing protein [bacterium]|nr:flippase-like domain-containing protein [bacterium]